MFVVYSDDRETLRRIESAFPRLEEVHATIDWHDYLCRLQLALCSVIGLPRIESWRRLTAIAPLPATEAAPRILVAPRSIDIAKHVRSIAPTDIVWLSDVERDLWNTVRKVTSGSAMRRIASCFRATDSLAPLLREAFARACTSSRPVTTVAALGASVARDRRTMWRLWRQTAQAANAPRLEDVLHWLLLVRAMLQKDSDQSWHSVARTLEVHEHTLARAANALLGTTLSCLTLQGPQPVTSQFIGRVMEPLAGDAAWDILR